MRYALNETPINGWRTMLGSGSAAMAMSSSGLGGIMRFGAGTAGMAVSTSGVAYSFKYGAGQAPMVLGADGSGVLAPRMSGQAAMAMSVNGAGVIALRRNGIAAMQLSAADGSVSPIAKRGSGEAPMVLTVRYGIPATLVHSGFIANTRDRTMKIGADDRSLTVSADVQLRLRQERPLRVARESRSL